MDAAGIISNCNAQRMSSFISGFIFRGSSSAGKPIRWSLAATDGTAFRLRDQ